MRAMKPLCSGINVSTNAGSNARTSPDLPDQQKQLTGRSLWISGPMPEKVMPDFLQPGKSRDNGLIAHGENVRWIDRLSLLTFNGKQEPST